MASDNAIARPIPLPAPVTIATLPLSFNVVSLHARSHQLRGLTEKNLLSLLSDGRATGVWLALGIGALRGGAAADRIEPAA